MDSDRQTYPWHERVVACRLHMSTRLHAIHPVLQKIFYNFTHHYAHVRLVDVRAAAAELMPLSIVEFHAYALEQIDKTRTLLVSSWLHECSETIVAAKDDIEALSNNARTSDDADDENHHSATRLDVLDSFFSAVAALMSYIMRSIVESTLRDLLHFVRQYAGGNHYEGIYDMFKSPLALPHLVIPFRIFLTSSHAVAHIETEDDQQAVITTTDDTHLMPSIDEAIATLELIVDEVVHGLDAIPRIENFLFFQTAVAASASSSTNNANNLTYRNMVANDEACVLECKQTLRDVCMVNLAGPEMCVEIINPTYSNIFQL